MVSERLKSLRNAKRVSQKNFAEALKVSQQTVASWEVGRTEPSNFALKEIADYFDVTTDYLLGRDKETVPLSKTQSMFLKIFDMLNNEGQDLIMGILNSLEITHSKESNNKSVIQKNSGGTNFLATGGKNNYRIVTS